MDDNFEQTISKALQAAAHEAAQAPFRRATAELTAIADGIEKLRNMDLMVTIPPEFAAAVARVRHLIEVKPTTSQLLDQLVRGPENPSNVKVFVSTTEGPTRAVASSSSMTLPDLALQVLQSEPDVRFTTSEIYRTLKSNGWTSESDDPKNVVNNALIKLWRSHDHVLRPGRGLYTWATELPEDNSGSLDDQSEPNNPTVFKQEMVME